MAFQYFLSLRASIYSIYLPTLDYPLSLLCWYQELKYTVKICLPVSPYKYVNVNSGGEHAVKVTIDLSTVSRLETYYCRFADLSLQTYTTASDVFSLNLHKCQ